MNRRMFTLGSVASVVTIAAFPSSAAASTRSSAHASRTTLPLDEGWSFRREDGSATQTVSLPHCVVPLSWCDWDPASWQRRWIYRRTVTIPPDFQGKRLLLVCERAMTSTKVSFNGHTFPAHEGGFLPFELDVTPWQREGENELVFEVDARWLNVPPAGSPKGPPAVDYYLPGGIPGSVRLDALPHTAVSNLSVVSSDVLGPGRKLDISCDITAAADLDVEIVAKLLDGSRVVAHRSSKVSLASGVTPFHSVLDDLADVVLWDVGNPKLYRVQVELFHRNALLDSQSLRIGMREAEFRLDGFYLNGRRLQLFGLNRHELFPYAGFAASARAMRADASYLRHSLNCNIVRCSHYPQSTAFLDACDELGLLVWEEIPGWQYLGDRTWQDVAVQNTEDMIRRDRHHPSIVIWGTRVNESANDPDLYTRTRELAKRLDPSRPTSGSMTPSSRKDWEQHWHEDVFAFDDYHADPGGAIGIDPALPGVPYMNAEAVGQYSYGTAKNFLRRYRRAGHPEEQRAQALLHAQAHDRAARDPRNAGVIAWCAFDYASPMNAYRGVKCPGVVDTFRIPKLGAAFYLAQVSPAVRPVLEPAFYWDAASQTGEDKPIVFSNCEELRVSLDGRATGSFHPDRANFPHLAYPPFVLDLPWTEAASATLKIEGFVRDKLVITCSMTGSRRGDRLWIKADDSTIEASTSDSTRVSFGIEDRFGNTRPSAPGTIAVHLEGAGTLLGDTTFDLAATGAVGAVWVRGISRRPGDIVIRIAHADFGEKTVKIRAVHSDRFRA